MSEENRFPKKSIRLKELDISQLNPHEETIEENLETVLNSLKEEKILKDPIIVDFNTKVILDGHHRYKAFQQLDQRKILCILVDYFSENIEVEPWGTKEITKQDVIDKGLSDELFPPKTSKHTIKGKMPGDVAYSLSFS